MAAPKMSVGKPTADRLPCNTTSFQKKSRSKLVSIPGTRPSIQNGQLIVSTGVTSLDYVIGGGLAVGTLLLIEEDRYDSYSRMLLKYFLAEGVVCGHELYVASALDHPNDILQELPAPILDDIASPKTEDQAKSCDPESQDAMKIAWRYQNLPKVQTALASSSRFGHYYDVSKTMDPEICQAARCHGFYLPEHSTTVTSPTATTPGQSPMPETYSSLLNNLQEVIHREGFDGSVPQSLTHSLTLTQTKSRNILRIGLHSLGSALWDDDLCCRENPSHGHALTTFLYGLRAMLRSSLSVAVVTVPSHLIQNRALMGNITRLCDTAIALESFRGSERETNPLYKDYHGLLDVRQLPYLNCLVCDLPDNKDLAFKLKRKQFTIEVGLCHHNNPFECVVT
ncbi:elongator complex protein 4 isoform X1 [Oncorhynchus keta]|uniref:elongator complex protein 4 isoform X1 n=1 Tax=Oncorhynchus keta TaxID=8018 RepID=UPI00227A4FB7|nr:elongator complex protein 4 isoform X1 [Oncorhynchus keta]